MPEERDEAVGILYKHIGNLPDKDFGAINMMPFAVDSEASNAFKLKVSKAIVNVFRSNGFALDNSGAAPVVPSRRVSIHCRACSSLLLRAVISDDGVANIAAPDLIATMAKLNPACPHQELTLEDHRRFMDEVLKHAQTAD